MAEPDGFWPIRAMLAVKNTSIQSIKCRKNTKNLHGEVILSIDKSMLHFIYNALLDFLTNIRHKKEIKQEVPPEVKKPSVPEGYKLLFFKCWLCTGKNKFAVKKTTPRRKFTIECSWCGLDNLVTVEILDRGKDDKK